VFFLLLKGLAVIWVALTVGACCTYSVLEPCCVCRMRLKS
jgi:hypothetical protein